MFSRGLLPFVVAASMSAPAYAASEAVLYSFQGPPGDGKFAEAGLLNVGGTLYGTTYEGGSGTGCGSDNSCGTLFSVTNAGKETVLHSFAGGGDGYFPTASLIDVKGVLYGTTTEGGSGLCGDYGCGTVFRFNPASGDEKIVYSFQGGSDGTLPTASLLDVDGTLYGTTQFGGGSGCDENLGCGTVFSVTTAGQEKVLYSFEGGKDGWWPASSLLDVGGTLYGTTQYGGGNGCGHTGCGTVFALTTAGAEKILYRFKGGAHGERPTAGLIDVKGKFYGTTNEGGNGGCGGEGCGTVFWMTTTGKAKILHAFNGTSDGGGTLAGLLKVGGTLYGTNFSDGLNYGTIFSITPAGTYSVLYSFQGGADGNGPMGSLIDVAGTLYGTTELGGNDTCLPVNGCGTIFSITP